jgi:hypothetical protein
MSEKEKLRNVIVTVKGYPSEPEQTLNKATYLEVLHLPCDSELGKSINRGIHDRGCNHFKITIEEEVV